MIIVIIIVIILMIIVIILMIFVIITSYTTWICLPSGVDLCVSAQGEEKRLISTRRCGR